MMSVVFTTVSRNVTQLSTGEQTEISKDLFTLKQYENIIVYCLHDDLTNQANFIFCEYFDIEITKQ